MEAAPAIAFSEVLPEKGLVYSECKELQPVLCKPKLLPIKSFSLERLERMERKLQQEAKEKRDADRVQRNTAAWSTAPAPGLPVAPKLSGAAGGKQRTVTLTTPDVEASTAHKQKAKEEVGPITTTTTTTSSAASPEAVAAADQQEQPQPHMPPVVTVPVPTASDEIEAPPPPQQQSAAEDHASEATPEGSNASDL